MSSVKKEIILGALLLAALNWSSCSMLGGLMGGGGGAAGPLPDASGIINDHIPGGPSLTGNSGSSIPFQIRTSNQRLDSPDGAKLYGHY